MSSLRSSKTKYSGPIRGDRAKQDKQRQNERDVENMENTEKAENMENKVDNHSESETGSSDKPATFERWDDLEINPKLLRGIYSYGFENPSPIQKSTIIPFMKGHDILGQAQSGTGKTGAFSVGVLTRIQPSVNATQAIIISPTHELSRQNKDVIEAISQYMKLTFHLLIGGTSVDEDIAILNGTSTSGKIPQIVIGCPGRIHDMLRRNALKTNQINMIVLDEADEMLSSGFKDQIYQIFRYMDEHVQIGLFSATMPEDVRTLTKRFMRDPIEILIKSDMLTLEGLKQYYIGVEDDIMKYETLKDIFKTISLTQCIIYCNSVKRVQDLTEAMKQDSFPVISIHSSMNKSDRKDAIKRFKNGEFRVLISSDVTARGIDIQQVSIVINFDLCRNKHTYLHRIGRSARWGRKGVAINFITQRDIVIKKEIEEWYNTVIEELPMDFANEIRMV